MKGIDKLAELLEVKSRIHCGQLGWFTPANELVQAGCAELSEDAVLKFVLKMLYKADPK
jgi:hypothetical protein